MDDKSLQNNESSQNQITNNEIKTNTNIVSVDNGTTVQAPVNTNTTNMNATMVDNGTTVQVPVNAELVDNNNSSSSISLSHGSSPNNKKKSTNLIIILLIILIICIGGYFVYSKVFLNNGNTSDNGNSVSNKKVVNKGGLYPGQEIYEIPIGIADTESGVYKKLCTVKMGGDLMTAGEAYNTAGEHIRLSMFASYIKNIVKEVDFKNYFVVHQASTYDAVHINFGVGLIKDDYRNSWEDLVNDFKKDDRYNIITEIGTSKYPAILIRRTAETYYDFEYSLEYKLSEDYMLNIQYNYDDERKRGSDKVLAQELYDLVTPV